MKKVLIIVGSLRKESFNKKLGLSVAQFLEDKAQVAIADISSFPIYNEDVENELPESVNTFKKQIEESDGLIFITPEYNRSIPGGLKNAIDWASRPDGHNSFKGKNVFCMGVSSGKLGTVNAQNDLKRILNYFDCRLLGQPELYLGPVKDIFDEEKNEFNEKTMTYVKSGIDKFIEILS